MARGDPPVTVLLPVRNAAATLTAAAASVLAQSFADFELLIVDDGSKDGTAALLATLAASDPRVRVLRPGRVGLVAALNAGLAAARGGLLARMDADDVAAPERLARQVERIGAEAELVLLGSGWRVVAAGGAVRRVIQPPTADAPLRAAMQRANPLAHPTVMMRLETVRAAGGYRAAFLHAEDYDLWFRLMERGRIGCLDEVLLDYQEHPGQVTWSGLEQRILSELGAQAAARLRAVGASDGGDRAPPLDRAALRAMGIANIAAEIVARSLGAAKDARAARQWRAMAAAARLGLGEPGLRARTRAHLALLWAEAAAAGLADGFNGGGGELERCCRRGRGRPIR